MYSNEQHKDEIGKMEVILQDWVPQKGYKLRVRVEQLAGETVYTFDEVVVLD